MMAVTTRTSFFGELREGTAELHSRTLAHPTVQAIGAGTLPEETFRYYIEQDYLFLLRYAKVLALKVSAADDLETMLYLSKLVHSTIEVEIEALRELYRRFGGDPGRLDEVEPAPTCLAYTNHLMAVALERNLLVTLAAMLPCQWGYGHIGKKLKEAGLPEDERYAAWIEEYASDEYGDLVDWVLQYLDVLAEESGPALREQARAAFSLSARYELAFWEMALKQETWEVTKG